MLNTHTHTLTQLYPLSYIRAMTYLNMFVMRYHTHFDSVLKYCVAVLWEETICKEKTKQKNYTCDVFVTQSMEENL